MFIITICPYWNAEVNEFIILKLWYQVVTTACNCSKSYQSLGFWTTKHMICPNSYISQQSCDIAIKVTLVMLKFCFMSLLYFGYDASTMSSLVWVAKTSTTYLHI